MSIKILCLFACSLLIPLWAEAESPSGDTQCESQFIQAEDITLDKLTITSNGLVRWNGKNVPLTTFEYRILKTIIDKKNDYSSTGDIAKALYGELDKELARRRVKVHMSNLRDKFESVDPNFHQIQTKFGWGYLWLRDDVEDTVRIGDLEYNSKIQWVKYKGNFIILPRVSQFNLLETLVKKQGDWQTARSLVGKTHGHRASRIEVYSRVREVLSNNEENFQILQAAFKRVDPSFDSLERLEGSADVSYRYVTRERPSD